MKAITLMSLLFIGFNCSNIDRLSQHSKVNLQQHPQIFCEASVKVPTNEEASILFSIKNISQTDTITLLKAFLPFAGNLNYDIFSVYSIRGLTEQVPFKKDKINYDSLYGKIQSLEKNDKHELDSSLFYRLLPQKKISFEIKLTQYFQFKESLKRGEHNFAVALNLEVPAVDRNFVHRYEPDSLDNRFKPVYYWLALPGDGRIYFDLLPYK